MRRCVLINKKNECVNGKYKIQRANMTVVNRL